MSSDDRHKERQAIYQTRRWKDLRVWMVQNHPLCEDCLKEGRITATEEIHHIKSPFVKGLTEEEKIRRAYDVSNLVALCRDCHIKRHHKGELTIKEKIIKYSE
jgi:5-methylcytosine-specific restriction protein A